MTTRTQSRHLQKLPSEQLEGHASACPHRCRWLTLALFITTLGAPNAGQAKTIDAKAAFEPSSITLEQVTKYTVTAEQIHAETRFTPPEIDGLKLTSLGTSQSVHSTYINGEYETKVYVSFNFRVQAERTGTFRMPAYELTTPDHKYRVPEASLTVLPPDGRTQVTLEELVRLRLACPEDKIYVGQNVRCSLELYVLSALSEPRCGEPVQSGDAFSQGKKGEGGRHTGARLDDLNYRKISWPVTFTPLKSGEQTISFDMPVEVLLPRQSRQRAANDVFSRFFDGDFFGMGTRRQALNVSTGELNLDILPLPEEGRPESFTGAVGRFTVSQEISADELKVGDPLRLRLIIRGGGNFDRIQPTELDVGNEWKTYTPKSEFEAADDVEYNGSKTFEYVLIPETTEIAQTPEIQFSFFDPANTEYVDLSPPPVAITVNEAPQSTVAFAPNLGLRNNGSSRSGEPALLPIHLLPGKWVSSMQPVFKSPAFLYTQALPLVLLGGAWLIRRRQLRLRDDHAYARRLHSNKAMRKRLQEARKAAAANDTEAFYAAAQRAIQESLAKHLAHSAETLTLAEIEEFLQRREADEKLISETRGFFESADAIRFAGGAVAQTLSEQYKSLNRLAAALAALR